MRRRCSPTTRAPSSREFASTGRVAPRTCLAAAERYLSWLERAAAESSATAVVDALFPFIPSLYGWGHSEQEVDEFLACLRAVPDADATAEVPDRLATLAGHSADQTHDVI